MKQLLFTSIQAPNQDYIGRLLSSYVGRRLGIKSTYVEDISWQERESLLDSGQVHVGRICGLPYIWKADQPSPSIELLVAPVMNAARYRGRPVYFSDVIVHRDSSYDDFGDLRGATWAYNEPNSQSGYNITRYYLATIGESSGFFGRVIEAGSHQAALDMVLNWEIDASAIDTTVLEIELQSRPEVKNQLRVIETLGPSPIPTWVISKHLSADLRLLIRQTLVEMDQNPDGRSILAQTNISRFVEVSDSDYDLIREMHTIASSVRW